MASRPKSAQTTKDCSNENFEPKIPKYLVSSTTQQLFDVYEHLGKGGFAWCYRAIDRKNRMNFALKVISKARLTTPHNLEKVKREIRLHNPLSHPNIVALLSAFDCPENVYLVLEYCAERSMVHYLRRMPQNRVNEDFTRYFMQQLILGVEYLHCQVQILHRDLKLGNLLLTESIVLKIADFGLACSFSELKSGLSCDLNGESGKKNFCGTPNYLAPEVIKKQEYSIATEAWAVGCIMYAMLFGRPPFETQDLNMTYRLISDGVYNLFQNHCEHTQQVDTVHSVVSYQARALIDRLLSKNAAQRPLLDSRLLSCDPFFQPLYLSAQNSTLQPLYNNSDVKDANRNLKKTSSIRIPSNSSSGDSGIEILGKNHQNPTIFVNNKQNVMEILQISSPEPGHQISYLSHALKKTYDRVALFLSYESAIIPQQLPPLAPFNQCPARDGHTSYVVKWVDYSNRYGLGYVMNDGRGCLAFNDGALATLDFATRRSFAYKPSLNTVERLTLTLDRLQPVRDPLLQERIDVVDKFVCFMDANLSSASANTQPQCHIRRVPKTGYHQQQQQFMGGVASASFFCQCSSCLSFVQEQPADVVFWQRTPEYIAFVLSDSTFQVNFIPSHVKVVLGPSRELQPINDDLLVTYLDPIDNVYLLATPLNLLNTSASSASHAFSSLLANQRRALSLSLQRAFSIIYDVCQKV